MSINRPHDTFFKQLMGDVEVLRDFLGVVLPEDILEHLELGNLEIIDTEKTDRKYKKYYLDISARCELCGREGEIYLVFEHKSYPDRLTLIQVLNYMSVVFEEDIKNGMSPRPILPVIFYHGRKRFSLPRRFSDYFDVEDSLKKYLLDFEIFLFDTNLYSNEELLRFSENMYLSAALLLFKNIFKDIKKLKPVLRQVLKVDTEKGEYLLNYVVMAKDIEEEEFKEILEEIGGNIMPSLAKRWLEQGRQQGLQQGIQQGIQKGLQQGLQRGLIIEAQDVAIDLLEVRFFNVPLRIKDKIKHIKNREILKQLHRLALKVKDLDEFEQDMEKIIRDLDEHKSSS